MPALTPPPLSETKSKTYLNYLQWLKHGVYARVPDAYLEAFAQTYVDIHWRAPKRAREDDIDL